MEPGDPVPAIPTPEASASGSFFPIFRLWASRLARWLALSAGIYACFLFIAIASETLATPDRVDIDSVQGTEFGAEIRGRTHRGAFFEVLAGERHLGFDRADWRGRFNVSVSVPPEAQSLWVRSFKDDNSDREAARSGNVIIDRVPKFQTPPRITLAYFIEDLRKLWVAGYGGTPGNGLVIQYPPRDRYVSIDSYGCFDVVIDLREDQEAPGAVRLDLPEGGDDFAVTRVLAENLPLSRTVHFELLSQNPRATLRVRVPVAHPHFVLLKKGLITPQEFGKATAGDSFFGQSSSLIALRKTADEGVVELGITGTTLPQSVDWYGTRGIGEYPLLTLKDRISMRFPEIKPTWYEDPQPSMVGDDIALWQGPQAYQGVSAGFSLTDLVRVLPGFAPVDEKPQDASLRDLIRRLSRESGAKLQSLWFQILLLIPFAGLIWLGRRRPFGSEPFWRALIATALVMALWQVLVAAAPSLEQLGSLLSVLFFQGPSPVLGQAFWIPFALFMAFLPRLWRHLVAMDFETALVPLRGGSNLDRVVFGFRSVYVFGLFLLYLAILDGIIQPAWDLPDRFDSSIVTSLSKFLCLWLILATLGFRAFLMGAGLTLYVLYRPLMVWMNLPENSWLARMSQEVIVLVLVLTVCPFLYLLVRKLTHAFLERRRALLLTSLLVLSALLVRHVPIAAAMTLTGGLLWFALGGIMLRLLLSFITAPRKRWVAMIESRPRLVASGLLLLSLLLAWPLPDPKGGLGFWQLPNLNLKIQELFFYVLALGLVLLLRDYARQHPSPIVRPVTLGTGIYMFAALLVNAYGSTWLLLPVPFLVALLFASTWLFRSEEEMDKLRAIPEQKRSRLRRLIQDVVDSGTATSQFAAIEKSLNAKLNSAEMTPEEYDGKLKDCRTYLEKKLELETVAKDVRSREAVFSVGGPDLWSNVSSAVKTGAVLALGPLLIALYEFLPKSRVDYPYPLVTLLTFIVSAAASWLLYAFFFGFYFTYLRGKSGLTKSIHLFFGLLLPFAVYRLLDTQSLTDMRPFFLWATQLFLFCSLLGLLAFDYRLLRDNQFRVRDLTSVHNVPALSAYASTAVAALVPTTIALFTDKFGDIMKFFVETVLGMPSGS
jgi:hypothetical protein